MQIRLQLFGPCFRAPVKSETSRARKNESLLKKQKH